MYGQKLVATRRQKFAALSVPVSGPFTSFKTMPTFYQRKWNCFKTVCQPTLLQVTPQFQSAPVVATTVNGKIKLPIECTAAFAMTLASPTHTVGTVIGLGTIMAANYSVEMLAVILPRLWTHEMHRLQH